MFGDTGFGTDTVLPYCLMFLNLFLSHNVHMKTFTANIPFALLPLVCPHVFGKALYNLDYYLYILCV